MIVEKYLLCHRYFRLSVVMCTDVWTCFKITIIPNFAGKPFRPFTLLSLEAIDNTSLIPYASILVPRRLKGRRERLVHTVRACA